MRIWLLNAGGEHPLFPSEHAEGTRPAGPLFPPPFEHSRVGHSEARGFFYAQIQSVSRDSRHPPFKIAGVECVAR